MSSQINILEVILRSMCSVFNDHIIVKFVLKLFQTYITLDYFLYLCNIIDVKLHRVFGHQSPK